ncbi:MAG: ATP-binding protein [Aridibacter sp.]
MTNDTLIGTVKGPGLLPHEYLIITKDNEKTRIGEFVYYSVDIDGEKRQIIGTIKGRKLVRNLPDAFLADPTTPPSMISSLIGLDSEGCEIYEIEVETIGYFSKNLSDFINPRIPPNPGQPIYLASSETLAEMLSPKQMAEAGSAHIGSLLTREQGEVPVVLSVKNVVSTHLAILASTGSGKSYTAGVLMEELMQPYNGAAVLIIDPHSEYKTLRSIQSITDFHNDENNYHPEVKIIPPNEIKVRFNTLTEGDIKYLLPEGTSDKMRNNLSIAFKTMKDKSRNDNWIYADLVDALTEMRQRSMDSGELANVASLDGLSWRLDARFGDRNKIFTNKEHIPLNEIYRPGQCTVLELSQIEQNEQQVIVATLLRRINKARTSIVAGEETSNENKIDYPVFTLLEEAHRFAPAGASVVSTNILKQILSEGRKFGVGIGLITQRPGKLDQDVLSQCMTQIIMRIVNPIDQQTIAQSVEGAGRAMLAELPALTKGQAIISGVGTNTPVMCRIRPRLTKHGGETFDAPEQWLKWHSSDAQEKREQEDALYLKESSDKPTEKIGNIRI